MRQKKGLATGTTSPGHYWEHRRKPKPRASESLRLPLKLFLCAASATGLLTLPPSLSWSNMPLPTPQLKSDRAHINGVTKKVGPNEQPESETNNQVTTLSIPACLKRTGKEMRIVVTDGSEPATPDSGLVRLLVRANAIRDQLLADRSLTFEDIAEIEGVVPSYATRLFRLTVLAPDIVSAILSGKHPPELTARRLMDDTRLPLDWNESGAVWGLFQLFEPRREPTAYRSSLVFASRSPCANSIAGQETAVPPNCANETRARRSQQMQHEFVSARKLT